MSTRKMFLPSTVIPGSRPRLDRKGQPVIAEQTIKERPGSPLSIQRKGEVEFIRPQPAGFALHFRNAAAKLRTAAHMASQGISGPADIKYAAPKDIVRVPLYRGLSARFANEVRGMMRRQQRQKTKLERLMSAFSGGQPPAAVAAE